MAGGRIWMDESGAMRGYIDWWSTPNGPQENTSDLTVVSYVYKEGSSSGTTGTWGYYLEADDQSVEDGNYAYVYEDAVEMGRIEKTVWHDNDGRKSIYISGWISGPSGTTQAGNSIWGGSWVDLDTIPRYLSITEFNVHSKSIDSVQIHWRTSDGRDYTGYSLNGSDWVGSATYGEEIWSNTEGIFNIKNLTPNTEYSLRIRCRRTDSQLYTDSWTIYFTTYNIGKISSVQDINLGDTTRIIKTNPSSRHNDITIKTINPETTIKTITNTTDDMVISFNQQELDTIYKNMKLNDSITLRYIITTFGEDNHTFDSFEDRLCILTGNQKTIKSKINNDWKRGKIWTNINGNWKRGVVWTKDNNNNWKRGI